MMAVKLVSERNLLQEAKKVLKKNWKGKYTAPSNKLYPHQWSWDSAFVSIGYSHYIQQRAQQELLSLFEGQWSNGMLPHIIFRSKSRYFPGPHFWQAELSEHSPALKTSAITQPPIHAIAALYVYKNAGNRKKAKAFLREIYPKLLAFHRYLFAKRDPEKSGLITIFHPWESGLDNSSRWDNALARIKVKDLPKYERVDVRKVNPNQRPSDEAYDKYVYLIEIMKKCRYDEEKVYKKIPFKIKDIVFSSILYVANRSLLKIGSIIGAGTAEIEGWLRMTRKNYFRHSCLQSEGGCIVHDFDLVTKRVIEKRTVASLIPIYTDLLTRKQANKMFSWMLQAHICGEDCRKRHRIKGTPHEHRVLTSLAIKEKGFSQLNYWRGPVWMNINWMLYKGLKNYKFYNEAEDLRKSIIGLIGEHGFYEYYNPITGQGLGSDNFSWTAALLIDLLKEEKRK
jgi:hypothetical protein